VPLDVVIEFKRGVYQLALQELSVICTEAITREPSANARSDKREGAEKLMNPDKPEQEESK
jgi:hypothetical protein